MEEDKCIEMDEIGSNDQEKGLPDEVTVEPPMDTDTLSREHEPSNEEYQEKNSDAEQGVEEQKAENSKESIRMELHPAEEVEHLNGAVEVNATKEE